jgi:protein-disulfide isomerase
MKARLFVACAVATVALGAYPQQAQAAPSKSAHMSPPKSRDWSLVVSTTSAGGFVMGNPDAKVKLIEYGSMTCPHCAHFDETAVPTLISKYVKTGKVSFEFRNYVRDTVDVSASLIARCNGAKRFFPLTRALFKEQPIWEKKIGQAPQDELTKLETLPPDRQFVAAAKIAGFQQWGAAHGIPLAKSAQCLKNQNSINQLVRMTDDATSEFPDFAGTPTFVINGTMVQFGRITAAEVWPTLETQIKSALDQQATSSTNGAEN